MLVSTADVRDWLHIPDGKTESNAKIQSTIKAVETFIDNWTNRKLGCAHYKTNPDYSYLDGTGTRYLYLPQYPVSWIGDVYLDSTREWDTSTIMDSSGLVMYWSEGKIYSEEEGIFTKGHRNIRVDYIAGYGTNGTITSTYETPYDLKQVVLEMVTQSFKEELTAVHTIQAGENTRMMQMLSGNSFWRNTLNDYKNYSAGLAERWECGG